MSEAKAARRDGIVHNPVLPGDYPDPSVVRVGEDYYMVASTFQFFPGVPVLHSKDLVNWCTIGHVITRREQMDLTGIPDSFGVFAPDISYHDGKFWVVVPYFHGQPRCTNIVYYADRPEGPYSDGVVLNHHFIDPSIFNDDDGRRYLAFGGGWLHELAEDGSGLIGEAKQVWPGTGGVAPEAPHLLKRDGWYYLLLAEGGTFFEHMATVARSRSIWGPYEPCPHNPVLSQRDPNKRLQKAGHGKLVQSPDGRWWMLHLGGRPLTPGGHTPLGRETMLEEVHWTEDGWFVVGDEGAPQETLVMEVAAEVPQRMPTGGFGELGLSSMWEWVRHPLEGGYALDEEGLTLQCLPYILYSPQDSLLLTRRWEHFAFEVETVLKFEPQALGEEAGLHLYRDTDAMLLFTVRRGIGQSSGQSFDVKRLHERQEHEGLYIQIDKCDRAMRSKLVQLPLEIPSGAAIRLRIQVDTHTHCVHFAYGTDDEELIEVPLVADAAWLYPENVARFHCFTAPRVGVFARGVWGETHGTARFTSFDYKGKGES